MADNKQTFTLDEKEYLVEDLSDENKTRLNLISFSDAEVNKLQASINLMMISKEKLVADLKANLEDDE
jgi:hypothetical protein